MNVTTKHFRFLLIALMPLAVALSIGGCPPGSIGGGGGGGGNADPTANAGADQTVTTNATVNLDGTASTDPDGDTLTFAWSQTSGTTVTLAGATTSTATFTAPGAAGTLTFELEVDDGNGNTDTDTVAITVNPPPPPPATCGDGNLDAGETCDNGALNSDVTPDACRTNCFPASCGDGVVDTGETCDDGNTASGDGCDGACQIEPPVLFIANFSGNNVTSYEDPVSINGNISPDTNLAGASTGLNFPSDIIVTGNGSLIASNFGAPNALTRYDDAVNTNGNLTPNGNVSGGATLLSGPTTLAVNATEDLVFVANITTDVITVYSNASGTSFNGNLPPIRTISATTPGSNLNNPFGINFGAGNDLYVANNGGSNVLVFANANSLNGDVTPTRIITRVEFNSIFDVFVDGADNLFVVDSFDDQIYIFNNASTLNGSPAPDFTLTVPGAGTLTAIAVDSNDTGYIVDNTMNAVYSYDNISTLNGTVAPPRTISGANTQMNGPIRVFLLEP